MHPLFSYEMAQSKVCELERQAQIDRLARPPTEIKASTSQSSPTRWLRRLVGRLAAV
jgi:hypothetical protein